MSEFTKNENCPCEAVRELKSIVERHEEQLHRGATNFAVINTKLNILLSILAVVGSALSGVVIKMMF